MPWKERSVMAQRLEFVEGATGGDVTMRELCRRFGITPDTGRSLRRRYELEGLAGLRDHSRCPHSSPQRSSPELAAGVLAVRAEHPAWGGRKIAARLRHKSALPAPAPSTITAIPRRHGRLGAGCASPARPWRRFARSAPNQLRQMDFRGHFPPHAGQRCHPLTVLDDCSRLNLLLRACPDEQRRSVQGALEPVFERYGLPDGILTDNGSPWGYDGDQTYAAFSLWLMRRGIALLHARPYHPQTQGKEERCQRSLQLELLRDRTFLDLAEAQHAFGLWRQTYSHERPHEALALATPASRYRPSPRPFTPALPALVLRQRRICESRRLGGR